MMCTINAKLITYQKRQLIKGANNQSLKNNFTLQ